MRLSTLLVAADETRIRGDKEAADVLPYSVTTASPHISLQQTKLTKMDKNLQEYGLYYFCSVIQQILMSTRIST